MVHIIGLGERKVSGNPEDSIKTFALASCVGIVVYNPKEQILGMAHIVLPQSGNSEGNVLKGKEWYYADTAVPLIFREIYGGYPTHRDRYQVCLFGGAISKNKKDMFCVGERNVQKIEEILMSQNIGYDKKNTGGHCSRTIEAFVKDGSVTMHTQDMKF